MGLTGLQLARQVGGDDGGRSPDSSSAALAPPSLTAAFWMILLLIPLSVFFSAVCLALAVLARSMKEGQYYMTPLYLVCLPLIFLTLAPGIELNLFYSLVPITGVSLLLRALDPGRLRRGLAVLPAGPGADGRLRRGGAALGHRPVPARGRPVPRGRAVRPPDLGAAPAPRQGADAQRRRGAVLLRADADLGVVHDPVPGLGGLATSPAAMAAGQVAFILDAAAGDGGPADVVARGGRSASTGRSRGTWRWRVGLALTLNPLVNELRPIVEWLFPISQVVEEALGQMMKKIPSLGVAVLLFAVVPAVCEELAFRGFILSGLERGHRTRSAILLSALLFGFLHVLLSLFQQLFNATLLGLVLGLLAVRSRSILPGILFHFINNALAVVMGAVAGDQAHRWIATWLYRDPTRRLYHWWWVVLGALISAVLLAWLWQSGGRAARRGRASREDRSWSRPERSAPHVRSEPASVARTSAR